LSKLRICIGPGEVAGYFSGLKAGFDALKVQSEHFVLMPNKFAYEESSYFLKNAYSQIAKLRHAKFLYAQYLGYILEALLRLCIFSYAIVRYDAFIFPGSGSFFKFNELFFLKLLRKKIIVVYLGSDARPAYFSGKHLDDSGKPFNAKLANSETLIQAKWIKKVEKYADVIVNHTATAQFFSRNFIRLHAIGMPVKNHTPENSNAEASITTRIVHAPSRPVAKGSMLFKQAIEELRAEGYSIELIELIGVSNSIVLKELSSCDFVIDELYSDVPMAMLATEAAALSKPVIVGGYYAEQYKIDNPSSELPPTLYVLPNEIKEAIRKLIDDENFRHDLGRRAFEFVTLHWSVSAVAKNYLRLIQNESISDNWKCNPANLHYFWGWGLSKDNWRVQTSEYISHCGAESLKLDHNPQLKQKILDEVKNFTI
jgi:glycosyltransferase involved in cell wall biosynthesis